MWHELNSARIDNIRITDAMQANICARIVSTIPSKTKKKIDPSVYRLYPIVRESAAVPYQMLKAKFLGIAAAVNSSVRKK